MKEVKEWAKLTDEHFLCIAEDWEMNRYWWVRSACEPQPLGPTLNQDYRRVAYDAAEKLIGAEDAVAFGDLVWNDGMPPI